MIYEDKNMKLYEVKERTASLCESLPVIREVTVNEQNPQAVGFYEHLGFETYKRTECDEEGNLYPLLYMKLG